MFIFFLFETEMDTRGEYVLSTRLQTRIYNRNRNRTPGNFFNI